MLFDFNAKKESKDIEVVSDTGVHRIERAGLNEGRWISLVDILNLLETYFLAKGHFAASCLL